MGNGSIPWPVVQELTKAVGQGVLVVRSTRGAAGRVVYAEEVYEDFAFIPSDTLNPQKARVLLQLALRRHTSTRRFAQCLHATERAASKSSSDTKKPVAPAAGFCRQQDDGIFYFSSNRPTRFLTFVSVLLAM